MCRFNFAILRSILPLTLAFVLSAAINLLTPTYAHATTSLDTLRPGHPRLFLHNDELPALKHTIETDPYVHARFEGLRSYADTLLTVPPNVYTIGGPEHTLLFTSRDIEGRVFALAGVYRITGERRYADRAIQEMLAAAAFPDWYPTHFLDTGEMTAAMGVGYDWLYDVLTPEQRGTIKAAITKKGIDPWLVRISDGTAAHFEHNNWNQVCNGGEAVGALAIADEDPARARAILDHSRQAIGNIMKLFSPDGGFEEGPIYWLYATAYNAMFLDALDSALGTDFDISQTPGFDHTGDYHMQSLGPDNLYANFGDADVHGNYPAAPMFWLARRFNKPFYAEHEREIGHDSTRAYSHPSTPQGKPNNSHSESDRFTMLLLLWSAKQAQSGPSNSTARLPLVQTFVRVDQSYLRSAWDDPNAWYIGFKGGDGHASHGHLDFGNFVLDALGQRWASDLGPDNYGLQGYFGPQRWDYYRTRTESHNTLTIDGKNQDLDSKAPIFASGRMGQTLCALADLSQTYKGKVRSWNRGIAMPDKKRVLLQDEVVVSAPARIAWNFHTFAAVKIADDGRSATLSLGKSTLVARILSPEGARFTTIVTQPPPPQTQNPGLTNLAIPLELQSGPQTIAVEFAQPEDFTPVTVHPLSEWK